MNEPQPVQGITEIQAEESIRALQDIARVLRSAYHIPAPYISVPDSEEVDA